VSEPTTLADLIGTDPLPASPPMRKCKHCAETKPFAPATWVTYTGKTQGWMCKACDAARSSRKARRRTEVARALRKQAAGGDPGIPQTRAATKAAVAAQLDATSALREGVRKVNDTAGRVLAKVFEYALDPASPHHEWALKMVAERVMPTKMFAELGLAAAGAAGSRAGGPSIQINVLPAAPVAPPDLRPAITVVPIERGASDGDVVEGGVSDA